MLSLVFLSLKVHGFYIYLLQCWVLNARPCIFWENALPLSQTSMFICFCTFCLFLYLQQSLCQPHTGEQNCNADVNSTIWTGLDAIEKLFTTVKPGCKWESTRGAFYKKARILHLHPWDVESVLWTTAWGGSFSLSSVKFSPSSNAWISPWSVIVSLRLLNWPVILSPWLCSSEHPK